MLTFRSEFLRIKGNIQFVMEYGYISLSIVQRRLHFQMFLDMNRMIGVLALPLHCLDFRNIALSTCCLRQLLVS